MYDVLNAYLENGLKIVLHKIPEAKTISCGLWVHQGSSYETDEYNGLSHLTEHLLFNAEDIHNKRRYLKNGSGTYDKILQNIIILLEHGIEIVLRINIDDETFRYPFSILDDIPEKYRNLVTISISNLFQNEGECSSYDIYLKAIKMGYKYGNRRNNYYGCATCGNRNISIDTDGNILFCTNVPAEEGTIGKLGKNGIVTYSNRDKYIQDIMKSARENETCKECIELPFCIGRCRLARCKKEHGCMGKANSGLSLEECAKLDYYYDQVCNGGTVV